MIGPRSWFWPVVASLLLPRTWAQCRGQDSATWKQRFISEAPQQWEEYRLLAKRLQGSCLHTSIELKEGKRLTTRSRFEFKQNATCASFLSQPLDGDKRKPGTVDVLNSRYA